MGRDQSGRGAPQPCEGITEGQPLQLASRPCRRWFEVSRALNPAGRPRTRFQAAQRPKTAAPHARWPGLVPRQTDCTARLHSPRRGRTPGRSFSASFFGSSSTSCLSQLIQVICPCLHHPTPLGQVFGIIVCRTDSVSRRVSQLPLDGIGMPGLLLIQ